MLVDIQFEEENACSLIMKKGFKWAIDDGLIANSSGLVYGPKKR
jgi:hypothetical protein